MVDISPGTALLVALQNQFASSRANAPQGNLGAGLPGLTAPGGAEQGSPGGPAAAIGAVGGGVPTTATTGQSVANALGGGASSLSLSDPVLQQVERNFFNQRDTFSGERPPAPGTVGGDVSPGVILAMMSGNPLTLPIAVARAIAAQGGADTIAGGAGQDFGTAPGFGLSESSDTLGASLPATTVFDPVSRFSALPDGGRLGGFGDRSSFGAGSSPRRGDISNAGR
jgi:hypothetical protein